MKVVIEIPDDIFESFRKYVIISGRRSGKTLISVIFNAVKNGTLLPKGHGKIVDVDTIDLNQDEFISQSDYYEAECAIENAPTIIEADTESEVKE